MKNKIDADSWFIACYYRKDGNKYHANIEYHLSDEKNTKSHQFDTFEEAYKWVSNQVNL